MSDHAPSQGAVNVPGAPTPLNAGALLSHDVSAMPDFATDLAPRKAYRLRGLSYVRENVAMDIARYGPYVPQVAEAFDRYPGLAAYRPTEKEPLSLRQMYDAAAKLPLRFDKAVQVAVLCQVAAAAPPEGKLAIPPSILFGRLQIEPALYLIDEHHPGILDEIRKRHADADVVIRQRCGQQDKVPHNDLAEGKTVSHRFATRVRHVLLELWPQAPIGGVILAKHVRDERGRLRAPKVCTSEYADGPSVVDPNNPFAP
jgi:hypothetical protein